MTARPARAVLVSSPITLIPKQLEESRVYFGLQFKVTQSIMVGKSQWREWLVPSAVRKRRRTMVVGAQLAGFSFVFNSGPNPAEKRLPHFRWVFLSPLTYLDNH